MQVCVPVINEAGVKLKALAKKEVCSPLKTGVILLGGRGTLLKRQRSMLERFQVHWAERVEAATRLWETEKAKASRLFCCVKLSGQVL